MAIEDQDFLGEIPDSPPLGKFTNRDGTLTPQTPGTGGGDVTGGGGSAGPGNGGGSGSYTPTPKPGVYVSPSNIVSGVGYEVLVLAGPDYVNAIAMISSHQGLSLVREVSGDGGGSITLNRDSPLFYTEGRTPTNLLSNPNFESQINGTGTYAWGWMVNSRSSPATYGTTASWAGGGSRSLYALSPGTGNIRLNTLEGKSGVGVSVGTRMTASAQAKPTTIGRPTRLYVDFYDAKGEYLDVALSIRANPVTTEPNVINYLRVDGIVPPGAKYASVGVEVSVAGVTGEEHRFDNFSFHMSPDATPFYDGRDKSDILDKENLWEVYYNGTRVHEFIGTVRSHELVNSAETRTVTISGVGTAELLKRVRVLPAAWSMRNGKPWVVAPIKMLKEDFKSGSDELSAVLNTKVWNKQVTMNVAVDVSDFLYPKIQIMNVAPTPSTERIGTGPWNFKNGATLPGDQSGIPNTLYFEAFPYLVPKPASSYDEDLNQYFYPQADFTNVWEIFISETDRCYIDVRSILTSGGTQTHNLFVIFKSTNAAGTPLTDQNITIGGTTPYLPNTHKWFRFRMATDVQFVVEHSTDGVGWHSLASKTLTSTNAAWLANLDQVTFRAWSYFTGILHAFDPVSGRPIGGAGQQGYTSGTGTVLNPVGKVTDVNEGEYFNPAFSSFGHINDNGVPDTQSPVYDQIGYYWWKAQNAKSSRGVLRNITFNWAAGNYREGISPPQPGTDSIGNKRKGPTPAPKIGEKVPNGTFKNGEGSLVNPLFVSVGVETLVPTGVFMPYSYKKTDGKSYYLKYTYTDPESLKAEEVFLIKQEVTTPGDGQTFYEFFIQSCNLAKCDWSMRPGRVLEVYDSDPELNDPINYPDKREENFHVNTPIVFFHEGYTTISKQMAKSSESIVNYVIGHDSKGNYIVARDDVSIGKWGYREAWVDVDYTDPTAVSLELAVNTILAIGVNEIESWTISVPVMDGCRPFIDYQEGDWIYVAKHTGADPASTEQQYDRFRVMAISLNVGLNSEETVELTLTSLVEDYLKKLEAKLNNVSATSQVATSFIPPVGSNTQINNTGLGSLGNVSVEGATPGSYLRFNSAGIWVAQPPDATTAAINTSYRSAPLGDGTLSYMVTHNLGTRTVSVHVYALTTTVASIKRGGASPYVGEDITGSMMVDANTPALLRTAVPIIVDENRVKIAWSGQLPLTAPAPGSFRVVVIRGTDKSTTV